VEEDWKRLKQTVTNDAEEVLRFQEIRKYKRLKLWNEDLKSATPYSKKESVLQMDE
jgi:hypothetical protein